MMTLAIILLIIGVFIIILSLALKAGEADIYYSTLSYSPKRSRYIGSILGWICIIVGIIIVSIL